MKTGNPDTASPVPTQPDSSKLLSLLALATGAVALPQVSDADIIYTDLSTNNVVVGAGNTSFIITSFPGTARLGFQAHTRVTAVSSSHLVSARQSAGYVRIKSHSAFVVPVASGLVWTQVVGAGVTSSRSAFAGQANYFGHSPNSYNDMYIMFRFRDSTQVGSPLRYGYVKVSLSNPASNTGPDLTILAYAWENSGAQIVSGATPPVPEPSSASLIALGALCLGANGLRSWRKHRAEEAKS